MHHHSGWNFSNLSRCALECDSLLALCYTDHAINCRHLYHQKSVMRMYHLPIFILQIKPLMQDRTVSWYELGLHVTEDIVFQKKIFDILKRALVSAFLDRVWNCLWRQRNPFWIMLLHFTPAKKNSKKPRSVISLIFNVALIPDFTVVCFFPRKLV